jgi:hypothetical protein
MGVGGQTTEWDGAQVAGDCGEAWIVGVSVKLSKSFYQNGYADALLLATVVMLMTVHLAIFTAFQFGVDFSFAQQRFPFVDTIKRVPLIWVTYEFIEFKEGQSYATKFLAEITLFTYVYLATTACILFAGWKNFPLLHVNSINRSAFYGFSFIMCCATSLVLFPTQVWGSQTMAFRWAVHSEARFLLLALLVVGSHLFTIFMTDLLRIYLKR